jgi:hypothetical protein
MPVSLDQLVAAAVEQRRPELAALVRQAVDAELARLIDDELAARENGDGHVSAAPDSANDRSATKVCSSCARTLPLARFARHRAQCRDCRNRIDVARRHRRLASGTVGTATEVP